jgi:uncharacterized membrane protein
MTTRLDPLSTLEQRLGRLFVVGLTVSAAFLIAGLALYLSSPGTAAGAWPLTAGLVVLMATPLLRVIVSMIEYVRMREWFFVLTTLAVLAELSITMIYALLQR